ncbi:MAG: phosphatase PAP2 family protein [Bacteroidota bacterium]|jgi:undecaprenyl-diphosphatase
MMELLRHIDHYVFEIINQKFSAAWLDPIMIALSSKWLWIPAYVLLLVAYFKKYKKQVWVVILLAAIVVSASDGISSKVIKPAIKRVRPNQIEKLYGVQTLHVRTPNPKDGNSHYGFVSSHAANAFAIFFMAALFLQLRKKWVLAMMCIPALIAYSRVYLGVHYPADVLSGALLGMSLAYAAWLAYGRCFTTFCKV